MAVSIRAEQISKRFGSLVALDEVSVAIEPGELFFLLGPSGCGKTTLLRCVAGFHTPESGRIWVGWPGACFSSSAPGVAAENPRGGAPPGSFPRGRGGGGGGGGGM